MELNDVKLDIPPQKNGQANHTEANSVDNSTELTHRKHSTPKDNSDADDKDKKKDVDKRDDIFKSAWVVQIESLTYTVRENQSKIYTGIKLLLLAGYLVYFGFAVSYHVGDEGSWRLIVSTIVGLLFIVWNIFKNSKHYIHWNKLTDKVGSTYGEGKLSLIVRW